MTESKPMLRLAEVDWLRAVSILYIVGLWHMENYSQYLGWVHHPVFYRVTTLALALFVLMSGFLLGGAQITSFRDAMAFWRRRLTRIYPPYLAAVVIFFLLKILGAPLVTSSTLTAMVVSPAPLTLWFVCMIVIFYILTPLFLLQVAAPGQYLLTVGALVLGFAALNLVPGWVDDRLIMYLPVFATGIAIRHHGFAPSSKLLVVLAGCSGVTFALTFLQSDDLPADMSLWQAPWALTSSVLVFLALRGRLPYSTLVNRAAHASYFLYLYHRPIYKAFSRGADKLGLGGDGPLFLVMVFLALPCAILFAFWAQRLYDRAVNRLFAAES